MTNDSPTALTELLKNPEILPSENVRIQWARKAKVTYCNKTTRIFRNSVTRKFVAVTYDAVENAYSSVVLDQGSTTDVKTQLLDALKDVVHSGDYGFLYYLASPPTAYLVMGDGDGDEGIGHTSIEEIKKRLLDTKLVTHVTVEAEFGPDDDLDTTYASFGRFGKSVDSLV